MAQHDYIISNATFPNTRADINNLASAIATNNSGTSAPSTQYAGQFWIDTTSTTWTLYIHDGSDDIPFCTIDTSANTINFSDSALSVQTDPSPTLGGDLDLNSNDITGTGNINITGTATVSGDLTVDTNTLYVDSSNNRVGVGTSSPTVKLEVESSLSAISVLPGAGGYSALEVRSRDNSNNKSFAFADRAGSDGAGAMGFYQYNASGNYVRQAFGVDGSGNVLVGTTTTGRASDDGITLAPDFIAVSRTSNPALEVMRRSTNGDAIKIRRDSTTAGTIRVLGGDILDVNGTSILTNSIGDTVVTVLESTTLRQDVDNSIDLGKTTHRWKDAYIGGNIYLGGTGSANALSDYEEGSFTPSILGTTTNPTITYGRREGKYFKIGKLVTVFITIDFTAYSGGSGTVQINGLPFTVTSDNNPSNGGGTIDHLSSDLKQITFQTRNAFAGLTPITNGGSTGSLSVVQCSNLTVNSDIRVQMMYYIN